MTEAARRVPTVAEGCRFAHPGDRPHFVRLWRALLEELREMGSYRLADEHNLYVFWDYFDAYTTGRLDGVVVFWSPNPQVEPVGVVMAGAQYVEPIWHLDRGGERWGHLWGVYVEPSYRGAGIGHEMELFGERRLVEKGFHQVTTTVQVNNKLGRGNWSQWLKARGVQEMETVIVAKLRAD